PLPPKSRGRNAAPTEEVPVGAAVQPRLLDAAPTAKSRGRNAAPTPGEAGGVRWRSARGSGIIARMRVRLERPSLAREREFLEAVRRSRKLHGRFVAAPSKSQEYREYLRRGRRRNQESFFVVLREDASLVGVVNVNEIVRYALQSGSLGYYAF